MRKQYCTTDQQVSKGCRYALHVDRDSVTVKKKNKPTKDLLLYSFLLEYLIDVLDNNTPQKNLPSITSTDPIRKSLRPAP